MTGVDIASISDVIIILPDSIVKMGKTLEGDVDIKGRTGLRCSLSFMFCDCYEVHQSLIPRAINYLYYMSTSHS
jgi:hypothetical protein